MENQATYSSSQSVPLDAFHEKSGIKKGLCSRTFYVGDYKRIIQGVLVSQVSAVVMLHHMALLADHSNGRIRRERVFRDLYSIISNITAKSYVRLG